jgi:hypothetical protein
MGQRMKVKIIKPCFDQDNRVRMQPGDVVELGDFERGRHLAEGNAVPYIEEKREAAIVAPPEIRVTPIEQPVSFFKRRGRPRK